MDLRKEVAQVVANLGIAGNETGFDDSDFRPPKPKPNAKTKKSKTKPSPSPSPSPSPTRRKGKRSQNDRLGDEQDGGAYPQKQGGKENGRQWNFGAGPKPEQLHTAAAPDGEAFAFSGSPWYAIVVDDTPEDTQGTGKAKKRARLDEARVASLTEKASSLVEEVANQHQVHLKKYGAQDGKWLLKARTTGTAKDKIAAASLLVEQNVVANLSSLDLLLNWITRNKGSREIVGHALEALCELFLKCLLPGRKLRYFADQPLGRLKSWPTDVEHKCLILWFVEDRIKSCYHDFVSGLEILTRDNLDYLKQKSIKASFDLLREKPEQESWLLSILVNKLGDPDRKVASKVVYLMQKLLEEHPGMKGIVVDEVENFLFRPQVTQRAQYTSAIFLNQMLLNRNEAEGGSKLAEKLINVYFNFFQVLLEQHDSKRTEAKVNKKHSKRKAKRARQAEQKSKKDTAVKQEMNHGIDSKMLSALLTGINRAFPYVNDNASDKLIERHSPKLFQLAHGPNFGTCIQALILLYQLFSARMTLSNRYYRALYSVLLDSELAKSTKSPLLLSILFKSLKSDVNKVRVAAFLNRLVQVSAESKSNFACGSLLLLSETMKHFPTLWAYVNENANGSIEKFHDVVEDEGVHVSNTDESKLEDDGGRESNDDEEGAGGSKENGKQYDMNKRDPEHCGMEDSCFWEIALLCKHFHPSVSVMSRTLSAGAFIVYDGDPLRDLNMSSFLGKFVQKKPKSSDSKFSKSNGSDSKSLMQPEDLEALDESVMDPSELFFHKFWSQKTRNGLTSTAQASSIKTEEGEGVYDEYTDAMFANDGEQSEESGEMSSSVEELEEEEDEEVSSELEEKIGLNEESNGKNLPMTGADDIFAPVEEYQAKIEESLQQTKENRIENLDEFLEEENSEEGEDEQIEEK